eukprot:gb/GECH01004257.1/.p1 GENE.gb/GECH01004257.1/~~gb/GECH01004257.1/.p1  ORF type:complete len:325 (+),score=87.96 gb/GECH01004257.1/:1-975(+)
MSNNGDPAATEATVERFKQYVETNKEATVAVAAVTSLTEHIKRSKVTTMMQLHDQLKDAVEKLKIAAKEIQDRSDFRRSAISVTSGCELFLRFVTRTSLEINEFESCKEKLIERGEFFAQVARVSREKIGNWSKPFFRDRSVILVHGHSRVVLSALLSAAKSNRSFTVYVTEARPDCEGYHTMAALKEAGIPATLIVDSCVGRIIPKVDFVLVGAEGVVENGGIINKVGTYPVAIAAQAHKKPVYVAAESFKFIRKYPLQQSDLPDEQQQFLPVNQAPTQVPEDVDVDIPLSDYTPPSYITLLFTDLGILTPSAISDELIKLYA